jgi:rSAM/selenodomain-associated transferase 1
MALSLNKPFTLAVAVFVKTPGRSPLKTRLAKTVGTEAAHKFYLLACKTIAQTLRQAQAETSQAVQPIWAVAEDDADASWSDFPIIHQGQGELGEKLHNVYSSLLARYDSVALIGADAPQITANDLKLTLNALSTGQDFVAGPASDGGFYLFAGKTKIEKAIWLNTPYSQSDTLDRLFKAIKILGTATTLHRYTDIDTFEDIKEFLIEIESTQQTSDDKKELLKHCAAMLAKI